MKNRWVGPGNEATRLVSSNLLLKEVIHVHSDCEDCEIAVETLLIKVSQVGSPSTVLTDQRCQNNDI